MAKYIPIKLSYKVFEPKFGSDPNLSPIIFMHGMTAMKEMWEDIPQIVADNTKTKAYAYDARNHGYSEYTDDFSFDLLTDDLFHFMDTMHINKAILVGHSMGSLTATNAALRKPEKVEMIFSEDMAVNKLQQKRLDGLAALLKMRLESVQFIPSELNETDAVKFANNYLIEILPDDSPMFKFIKKEDLREAKVYLKRKSGGYELNCNLEAILPALQNAESLSSEPIGQYNGPAYFIYGTESPLKVNEQEESIKKHFPKAELIEFEGATHNVHLEFPEKFAKTLLSHLLP